MTRSEIKYETGKDYKLVYRTEDKNKFYNIYGKIIAVTNDFIIFQRFDESKEIPIPIEKIDKIEKL